MAEKYHTDEHLDAQYRLFLLKITSFFVKVIFLEYNISTAGVDDYVIQDVYKKLEHIRAVLTYIVLLISSCSLFLYDVKYSVENLNDKIFYIKSKVHVSIHVFAGFIIIVSCSELWLVKIGKASIGFRRLV